jgi:hypothetical protein
MISGLWNRGIFRVFLHFYERGIKGRESDILFTQETSLAILLGVFITIFGHHFFSGSAKIVDIAVGYLGYAAIALGFCVGGMTIALTFPDREFITGLATFQIPDKKGDALSSLLFVFSWTALVHWISLVVILAAVLIKGHQDQELLSATSIHSRVIIGTIVALCSYALMQFVITVLTLWQIGGLYIDGLKRDAAKKS